MLSDLKWCKENKIIVLLIQHNIIVLTQKEFRNTIFGGMTLIRGFQKKECSGLFILSRAVYETDPHFFQIESWDYLVAPAWSCPQPLQPHSLPGTGTSPHRQVWRGKISELRLIAQTVCDLKQIKEKKESDILSYKHRLRRRFQAADAYETVPG